MEEFAKKEDIPFDRIKKIANDVAKYAGRYSGRETFLGHSLEDVAPLASQHEHFIPPDGEVKIVFAQWSLLDEMVSSSSNPYPNPETMTQRIMSYVVSAEDLLEYEVSINGCNNHDQYGDPTGDFDLLDWNDNVAVSCGCVPDEVVEELCNYLKNQRRGYLDEEFREMFFNGELPNWDPRILKIVEDDCRNGILEEKDNDTDLENESAEQGNQREVNFRTLSRTVSSCWISKEFSDNLASIKNLKEILDKTDDPAECNRLKAELEFLFNTGLVTEDDFALSERLDREKADES
jgi:hypothetical protein